MDIAALNERSNYKKPEVWEQTQTLVEVKEKAIERIIHQSRTVSVEYSTVVQHDIVFKSLDGNTTGKVLVQIEPISNIEFEYIPYLVLNYKTMTLNLRITDDELDMLILSLEKDGESESLYEYLRRNLYNFNSFSQDMKDAVRQCKNLNELTRISHDLKFQKQVYIPNVDYSDVMIEEKK